jgi:flagellum-specific peptidoglycan hydrolase FlgJ
MDAATFTKQFFPLAVKAAQGTTIKPELILAAAMLESNKGKSNLSKKYNNYFGIKANKSWRGKVAELKTKEYTGTDNEETITAKFRAYNSPADSFNDYVNFLKFNPRYKEVFNADSIEAQAREIFKAGYATGKDYDKILSSVANSVKKYIPLIKTAAPVGLLVALGVGALLILKNK